MYAGGPPPKGNKGSSSAAPRDEIAIAGLEQAHVVKFESMGFQRAQVVCSCYTRPRFLPELFLLMRIQIDVLRRLNYRGANVTKIQDDRIVEELLK